MSHEKPLIEKLGQGYYQINLSDCPVDLEVAARVAAAFGHSMPAEEAPQSGIRIAELRSVRGKKATLTT